MPLLWDPVYDLLLELISQLPLSTARHLRCVKSQPLGLKIKRFFPQMYFIALIAWGRTPGFSPIVQWFISKVKGVQKGHDRFILHSVSTLPVTLQFNKTGRCVNQYMKTLCPSSVGRWVGSQGRQTDSTVGPLIKAINPQLLWDSWWVPDPALWFQACSHLHLCLGSYGRHDEIGEFNQGDE